MRRGRSLALGLLGLLMLAAGTARPQTHVLRYTPPANVFRSSIPPVENYSFNGFNAQVQVYAFREFSGDITQAFQRTLLREWISPMYQEENVAGRPNIQRTAMPGADLVLTAAFSENRVGLARPHMRMLIVAGNEAAIVDASAGTAQSWQQAVPALNRMASTMRIERERAAAPLTASAGHGVDNGKLVITMKGEDREKIVTDVPKDGQLVIYAIPYKRQK